MNIRARHLFLAAPFVLVLAGPAMPSSDDRDDTPPSCVRTQMISDWRPLDDSSIVVRTAPKKAFKVTFMASCRHLNWSVFARVSTRPTGTTICLSRGDIILFGRGPRRDGGFEQEEQCVVSSVVPHEEPPLPPAPPPAN